MTGLVAAVLVSYTTAGLLSSLVAMIHKALVGGPIPVRVMHTMTSWGACAIFAAALLHAVL